MSLSSPASPQATVQMECFGQFKKEDKSSPALKPETIVIDARNVVGRPNILDTSNDRRESPDIIREQELHAGDLDELDDYSVDDEPVLSNDMGAGDERDILEDTEPRRPAEEGVEHETEYSEPENEKSEPQPLNGQDELSNSRLGTRSGDLELNMNHVAYEEDIDVIDTEEPTEEEQPPMNMLTSPDAYDQNMNMPPSDNGDIIDNDQRHSSIDDGDSISDAELDSMIQTILQQIDQPVATGHLLPPDELNEDLEVNIAKLMANEIENDGGEMTLAELVPPTNDVIRADVVTELIPLEYDNVEELRARARLENQAFDINNNNLNRQLGRQEHKNDDVDAPPTIPPPSERVTRRDLTSRRLDVDRLNINRAEVMNNPRVHRVDDVQQVVQGDRQKPWWHRFTVNRDVTDAANSRQPFNRDFRPISTQDTHAHTRGHPQAQLIDRWSDRRLFTRSPNSQLVNRPPDVRVNQAAPAPGGRQHAPGGRQHAIMPSFDANSRNLDTHHSSFPNPAGNHGNQQYPQPSFPQPHPQPGKGLEPKGKFTAPGRPRLIHPPKRKFPLPVPQHPLPPLVNGRSSNVTEPHRKHQNKHIPKFRPNIIYNPDHGGIEYIGKIGHSATLEPLSGKDNFPGVVKDLGSKTPSKYHMQDRPHYTGGGPPRARMKPIARFDLSQGNSGKGLHGAASENEINKMRELYKNMLIVKPKVKVSYEFTTISTNAEGVSHAKKEANQRRTEQAAKRIVTTGRPY